MAQARTTANGVGSPSPLDLLIEAMLRMFAELVSHLARLFRLKLTNPTAECDCDQAQTREADEVPDQPEGALLLPTTTPSGVIATRVDSNEGLMVSSTRSVRPSNHEAGLTAGEHEQPQQQQQRNNNTCCVNAARAATSEVPNSLNASFSGKRSASRESRLSRRWNSKDSRRRTDRDSRHKAENDALHGLRLNAA